MSAFDDHPRKIAGAAGLTGAALSLALSTVANFEGKRNYTYFDIVGVPTYCYGGTGDAAKIGAKFSDATCDHQLSTDLQTHWQAVLSCAPALATISDTAKAAMASLSYNIGSGTFCRSSIPGKLQAHQILAACNTLKLFISAKGRVLTGLVLRRQAEYNLCIKGLV